MGTGLLVHTEKETYWEEIAAVAQGRFMTIASLSNPEKQ
jgi:hypothetical protein